MGEIQADIRELRAINKRQDKRLDTGKERMREIEIARSRIWEAIEKYHGAGGVVKGPK